MKRTASNKRQHRNILGAAVALALATTASPHLAAQPSGAMAKALEEVLVTARKRAESIQEVPVSVTSVSRELREATIRRLDDIQSFTPNVYFRNTSGIPGGAAISIRGVSYQETDKSFDPAIGVIMDGLYLGTSSGSLLNNFDIERIEVLRGPQGTLFGKNTVGGVVNVIRSPVTMEWGLDAAVTIGEDGRQDYEAILNMPIIEDKLGLKIFGMDLNSDGYMRNVTLGENVGGDDYQTLGFTTLWKPTDNFNLKLLYEHHENGTEAAWANFNQAEDLACIIGGCRIDLPGRGLPDAPNVADKNHVSSDRRNENDSEYDTTILTMNWDLDSFLLTSITGYREQDENYLSAFDSSVVQLLYLDYRNQWDQFSQELRVTSQFSETFEFVAGIYYWDVEYEQDWDTGELFFLLDTIGQIVPGVPGGAGFNPNTLGANAQFQETESIALFFSGDWHINDQWTVTAGLRWTEEKKDFLGGASQFYTAGDPFPEIPLTPFDDEWSEVSPKLGFRYQHNDDIMFFGSYAEGFKSGGFFGRQSDFNGPDPTYEPEFVDNYELGMKSEWLDGSLIFNPTVFYSNYDDKQEEVLIPLSLSNVATVVRNASTLEIFGVEMELQYQVTESWYLRGSYGYLDAEFDDFIADLNGDGIITDNSDLRPRNTPEHTFGLSSSYTWNIGSGELNWYTAYRWRDEIEVIANNDPLGSLGSIQNLDMTLSYVWDDGRYRLTAYGRNLTDEREVVVVRINGLTSWGNWNEGQVFGVEFALSI